MFTQIKRSNMLPQQFDNAFEGIFQDFFNSVKHVDTAEVLKNSHYPKLDIADEDDALLIYATVPGLDREDIDVDFDGETECLTISTKKSTERSDKNYTFKEIKMSSSSRVVNNIRSNIFDVKNISAELEKGILEIKIPRIETKQEAAEKRTST